MLGDLRRYVSKFEKFSSSCVPISLVYDGAYEIFNDLLFDVIYDI